MSSYSLILMLIYFLQIKKILPSLQQLSKILNVSSEINLKIKRWVKGSNEESFETDISFINDINKVKEYIRNNTDEFPLNSQTLFELLDEFFKFYNVKGKSGAFKENKLKCNIKTGKIHFINIFSREKEHLFSIVDPFDKKHNPGDRVRSNKSEIEREIEVSVKNLNSKLVKDLEKLFKKDEKKKRKRIWLVIFILNSPKNKWNIFK